MPNLLSTRTATKEHRCYSGGDTIRAGETYLDETIPPWVQTREDPEEEPRDLGTWVHLRSHVACYEPSSTWV